MSNSLPVWGPDEHPEHSPAKKRSPWRMRLIEAERGFSFGFKNGSALFGHIFVALVIVISGMTFGLELWGWTTLIVAMCCGIASELFHHSIRVLADSLKEEQAKKAIKLSAAGMMMVMLAAGTVIVFVLGSRLSVMFSR
jgi:diacylglycerol kinase